MNRACTFSISSNCEKDVPAKDEVTEVDDVRSSVYAALLVFTVLCLIPLPSDLLSTDPF